MNKLPWYTQLFNTDLLNQTLNEWREEAKEKGITLEEYIEQKEHERVALYDSRRSNRDTTE